MDEGLAVLVALLVAVHPAKLLDRETPQPLDYLVDGELIVVLDGKPSLPPVAVSTPLTTLSVVVR